MYYKFVEWSDFIDYCVDLLKTEIIGKSYKKEIVTVVWDNQVQVEMTDE